MHADGECQSVEVVLSSMATLGEYLQTWNLKLSTTKTVSAVFHPKNNEAKRELKVNYSNETLPFFFEPKYLRVTLTGRSRIADTLRHFARSWHYVSHS